MSRSAPVRTEATVLCPQSVARRKPPINLRDEDRDLFSHDMDRIIPPTRRLELRRVAVSPEGVLFRRGRMLPESFAYPENRQWWARRRVLRFFVDNYGKYDL